MIDREAFVSRLILEAETPLEREAVTELQIAGLEIAQLKQQLAAHQPRWITTFPAQSLQEASDAISATINADIRMAAPWGELERLRAIVRDLAAASPLARWRDYEEPYCTLCHAEGEEQANLDTVDHAPGCPWLRATQEVAP